MLLKTQKYYCIMNFNFVFISYSVIYAKYSYCYEVPKEQPQRYFDGKEWRIVKSRPNIRPKVPRHSNITIDLDFAEPSKEIEAIEFKETTTQTPISVVMTTTVTTKKATFKRVNTIQYRPTVKETTKKIFTTKVTSAPKFFMRAISHFTFPTTTKKINLTHCRPVCKLKLKSSTVTAINPQLLPKKMTINRDWKKDWNYWRPTKKPSPVMSKQYTPKVTKNCYISTIKNVCVTTTKKIVTKGHVTTTKKPMSPYRGPVTTTWNPVKPMNRPVITTKKLATTIRRPTTITKTPSTTTKTSMTTTKTPVTKTAKLVNLSGKQAYVGNATENWPNLLKEFLKYVDEKKCQQPPCDHETTSTIPYPEYKRIGHGKITQKDNELMNILMDGVEIDDTLNEEGDDASKNKETLEYEGQWINYDSIEGSVSQMKNDYRDLKFDPLKDSIIKGRDIRQFSNKMEYLTKFYTKNSKDDFITSHNRESEINLDEFSDENKNEDDEILEDYEAKTYPGSVESNHAKERNLNSQIRASEEYLDELEYEDAKKDEVFSDIDTKADSDALKNKENFMFSEIKRSEVYSDEIIDKNTRGENEVIENNVLNYFTNSLKNKQTKKEAEAELSDSYLDGENDKPTETINSMELNDIEDYTAPNPTELTSQTNDEDLLRDSDITFDIEDNV